MADIAKVKRNIKRMIDGGASEDEIDSYIGSVGVSIDDLKSEGMSRTERFKMGATDPLVGLGQLGAHLMPDFIQKQLGVDMGAMADAEVQQREQDYLSRRGDTVFDGWRMAGNVATTVPAAFIPGGQTVLGSAAIGAGISASQPVTGDNYWSDKALQAGTGAVFAGGATLGMNALARSFKPRIDPELDTFIAKGGLPTPGRAVGKLGAAIEERTASLPVIGDAIRAGQARTQDSFNKMMLNETIAPINAVRAATNQGAHSIDDIGREGLNQTRKYIGQAFDKATAKMQFAPDQEFVQQYGQLRQLASTMPDDAKRTFDLLVKKNLDDFIAKGPFGGKTIQTVERNLNELAKSFSKSSNATEQNILGKAFQRVYEIFDDALERMNPVALNEYKAAKAAYARAIGVKTAVNMPGSVNGRFSPDALRSGLVRSDQSVGRWRWAVGEGGPMQILTEIAQGIVPRIPNSGTADRLTANIAGYGALGASAITNPVGTTAVMSPALAYTGPGQRAISAMASANRPGWMMGTGEALRRLAGPVGVGGAAFSGSTNR